MIALIVLLYLASVVVGTLVMAGSLFLVEDIDDNSFKRDGVLLTIGKCGLIVLAVTLVNLLPWGGLLGLLLYFVGVMFFFQKTLGQSFVLLIVNGLFGAAVGWLLEKAVTAMM